MKLKTDIKAGDKFGRWVVLEANVYNPNSKSKTKIRYSLCQCSCPKKTIKYIQNTNLRNGKSLSCGCLRGELLAIKNANNSSVKVGNKYGKLLVIQDLGMRPQPSRNKQERWSLCQCDCGSLPIEVKNNMLQSGWKKSCGCLQSQGEFIIEKILKENKINFIKEYSFDDLLGKKNHPLRFDFAIFKNDKLQYLIEFDGKQHYTGPEATWKNTHSLEEIQEYDSLKDIYCSLHNIELKRIPYYDLQNISYEKICSTEYNIQGEKIMSHAIRHLDYHCSVSEKAILKDISSFAYDPQESSGYHGNLTFHKEPVYKTRDEAMAAIEKLDRGWYSDHAVMYWNKGKKYYLVKVEWHC